MTKPNVLILRAPGTNCDKETAFAFEQAGAKTEILHVNRLLETPTLFDRFQILCIPGGFSYGDDVAAGRILGNQFQHHLTDQMRRFKEAGKLILGICNGFQVMIKSGILFDADPQQGMPATLTWNDSGRFEDRWVELGTNGDKCVFLKGIERMYLPIAHAEGKFVARDRQTLAKLEAAGHLALRYLPLSGAIASATASKNVTASVAAKKEEVLPFPDNPNGSWANVAGACDASGRVFGLMPHPERHIDRTQHPRWTRPETTQTGDGLAIFVNAVKHFA